MSAAALHPPEATSARKNVKPTRACTALRSPQRTKFASAQRQIAQQLPVVTPQERAGLLTPSGISVGGPTTLAGSLGVIGSMMLLPRCRAARLVRRFAAATVSWRGVAGAWNSSR